MGVIKFNQKAKIIHGDKHRVRKENKKRDFGKYFFKLMNNSVFGKALEKLRKHRDIKLATTEERRIHLVLEPNYHSTKFFVEHFLQK